MLAIVQSQLLFGRGFEFYSIDSDDLFAEIKKVTVILFLDELTSDGVLGNKSLYWADVVRLLSLFLLDR